MTCLLEPPFRCLPPFQPFSPRRFRCSAAPGAHPLPPDTDPAPEILALPLDGPKERREIVRLAWEKLVRWSRSLQSRAKTDVLERTNKVSGVLITLLFSLIPSRHPSALSHLDILYTTTISLC